MFKTILVLILVEEIFIVFGENLCKNCLCKREIYKNFPVSIVDCNGIGIDTFPDKSQINDDLNIFDLSFNQIQQLNQQNFANNNLNILKLSYNYIQAIDGGFFKNLPNLEELYLDHNQISEISDRGIFEKLPNLVYLDLNSNYIKKIAFGLFVTQPNLRYLDLSYNKDLAITWLNISDNYLNDNLAINVNITHLKLNQIGLSDLSNRFFDDYQQLKHVSLSDNYLEKIPNLPYSIEYLDLSGTNIQLIQAKYLNYHSLKVLKLNRLKRLVSIHKYAFYNLQSLEELYITNCNQLDEFNELVFGLLTKELDLSLKKLSLSGNNLNTLNYTYQYLLNKLDFVDLSYNPWRCDCDLIWLKQFVNLHNIGNSRCSSPESLKRKLVTQVQDSDVPDCYPEKYGKRAHRILLPILGTLIIILSALISYLIFYSPNWYNGYRSTTVGPQSPYNPTRLEQD